MKDKKKLAFELIKKKKKKKDLIKIRPIPPLESKLSSKASKIERKKKTVAQIKAQFPSVT